MQSWNVLHFHLIIYYFREAQKRHPLRLMAAMYKCIVQTNAQALGKVHTVLSQRRAKVYFEE